MNKHQTKSFKTLADMIKEVGPITREFDIGNKHYYFTRDGIYLRLPPKKKRS